MSLAAVPLSRFWSVAARHPKWKYFSSVSSSSSLRQRIISKRATISQTRPPLKFILTIRGTWEASWSPAHFFELHFSFVLLGFVWWICVLLLFQKCYSFRMRQNRRRVVCRWLRGWGGGGLFWKIIVFVHILLLFTLPYLPLFLFSIFSYQTSRNEIMQKSLSPFPLFLFVSPNFLCFRFLAFFVLKLIHFLIVLCYSFVLFCRLCFLFSSISYSFFFFLFFSPSSSLFFFFFVTFSFEFCVCVWGGFASSSLIAYWPSAKGSVIDSIQTDL